MNIVKNKHIYWYDICKCIKLQMETLYYLHL